MKNYYFNFCAVVLLVTTLLVNQSCSKPFDGVDAILTNNPVDYAVNIQIIDANAVPLPSGVTPSVFLTGDAIKSGLIYTNDSQRINENELLSTTVLNNVVYLAVKPLTVITVNNPLKFTINVEAAGFVTRTKDITITANDKIQAINLGLLKLSALPEGVEVVKKETQVVGGALANNLEISTPGLAPDVVATVPKSIVFYSSFDGATTPVAVNSSDKLVIDVTSLSAKSEESVASIPGGITAATTTTNGVEKEVSFIVAGAIDINAYIGSTEIHDFSEPIPFKIQLDDQIFNPGTKGTISAGDQIPVWSRSDDSPIWKREGDATVKSAGGKLFTDIQVSHLSIWMVAYGQETCASPTVLTYNSNDTAEANVFIKINVNGGTNQIIDTKQLSLTNGEKITIDGLPIGVDFTVSMYKGSSDNGTSLDQIEVAACSSTAILNNTVANTNPSLYFDLETRCQDGTFRYSGAIQFKAQGSGLWESFTSSTNGKLTTNLLEWGKTYDFKIVYKGEQFVRTKTVNLADFTQVGSVYNYTLKTFFSTPSNCQ